MTEAEMLELQNLVRQATRTSDYWDKRVTALVEDVERLANAVGRLVASSNEEPIAPYQARRIKRCLAELGWYDHKCVDPRISPAKSTQARDDLLRECLGYSGSWFRLPEADYRLVCDQLAEWYRAIKMTEGKVRESIMILNLLDRLSDKDAQDDIASPA